MSLPEKEKIELPLSLKEKLASLEAALLAQNPSFATALNEIHKITLANPEFVYALSDEEIALIVSGMSKYTQVEIEATKKKPTKKDVALMNEDSV